MIVPMYSQHTEIQRAGSLIQSGGAVVFPTETVYGLGANALDAAAVGRIFLIKGRPADNPLIVHVAEFVDIGLVARDIGPIARRLFEEFAPGPLTVVLPARPDLPRVVTAGLDTVAVRMPAHPVAHALLLAAGVPVAAPSANRSGEPSPTTVEMARRSLRDGPDAYLDGGPCEVGLESTVLSLVEGDVRILRPGAITEADILSALPASAVRTSAAGKTATPAATGREQATTRGGAQGGALSPGLRHAHYRPAASVLLWDDAKSLRNVASRIRGGGTVVVLTPAGLADQAGQVLGELGIEFTVREFAGSQEYARNLYSWFSECDMLGVSAILACLPEPEGIGLALRDRLTRAAGLA